MKNNLIKNFFLSGVLLLIINVIPAQEPVTYFPVPEGYGKNVTGGGNVTPVIVTTYTDLKTQLLATGQKVILVSGTITVPAGGMIQVVASNKTLLGLPGARLVNLNQSSTTAGILYLKSGSNNVIIRNLIFIGPGAYDVDGQDNLSCEGTNFWVDHCEFQDGMDGNFDITKNADYGTVSWCKFTYLKPPKSGGSGGSNDHRFSNLLGSSATSVNASGHYHITFQCNYWAKGCVDRMPRTRNAAIHILNCYYNTEGTGNTALGVGGGVNNSTLYVEGCNFASIKKVYSSYDSTDGGSESLTFVDCIKGVANVGTEVVKPDYTYSVFSSAKVAVALSDTICGAGATLQITEDGTISSKCNSTGLINTNENKDVVIYPTFVTNNLTIDFKNPSISTMHINIFSINGQKVLATSDNYNASVQLNVSDLKAGIYFCTINNPVNSSTFKFIKQ